MTDYSKNEDHIFPICDYCGGQMKDITDDHGLGECCPICPTCDGSGSAVDGWKPIESAPKDGTSLILWNGSINNGCVEIGLWCRVKPEGWIGEEGQSIDPTYWMPLPPRPSEDSAMSALDLITKESIEEGEEDIRNNRWVRLDLSFGK